MLSSCSTAHPGSTQSASHGFVSPAWLTYQAKDCVIGSLPGVQKGGNISCGDAAHLGCCGAPCKHAVRAIDQFAELPPRYGRCTVVSVSNQIQYLRKSSLVDTGNCNTALTGLLSTSSVQNEACAERDKAVDCSNSRSNSICYSASTASIRQAARKCVRGRSAPEPCKALSCRTVRQAAG